MTAAGRSLCMPTMAYSGNAGVTEPRTKTGTTPRSLQGTGFGSTTYHSHLIQQHGFRGSASSHVYPGHALGLSCCTNYFAPMSRVLNLLWMQACGMDSVSVCPTHTLLKKFAGASEVEPLSSTAIVFFMVFLKPCLRRFVVACPC